MTLEADISSALAVLRRGGVILYPTDTVWGLGCDATNAEAVARIFAIKRRADSKAMLSLVDSPEALARYVAADTIRAAAAAIAPSRPTTVIYPHVKGLAEGLTAPDGSAGFRICGAEYASRLCRLLGHPLVSTSANISGEPAPATFSAISPDIIASVDYVAEHGRDVDSPARPSRIVLLNPDCTVTILRQ